MKVLTARLLVPLLLVALVTECKANRDDPCYEDEMCAEGLVCHERYCEPAAEVRKKVEQRRYGANAVEGLRQLVHKCQALYDTYAAMERWSEQMGETMKEQFALEPGDEVEVETEVDQKMLSQLGLLSLGAEEAFYETMRVAVPLRDENPVFRQAVRAALLEMGKEGEPGPASSVEIDFCDPDLLQAVWERLGEPYLESVTE